MELIRKKKRDKGESDAYIEITIHDLSKLVEGLWVDEEGRDEEDSVLSCQFGVTGELGCPAFCDGSLAEIAVLASKGGCKDAAAVSELIGVVGISSDIITEVLCVIRRIARDGSRGKEGRVRTEGTR